MDLLKKMWRWIDHNRFTVVCPIIAIIIWTAALCCTPVTFSPLRPDREVTAVELERDLKIWQQQQEIMLTRFEFAQKDLEQQEAEQTKIRDAIIKLASGNVADLAGLIQILIGGGLLGAVTDNIRKRGLISGLKRNKKNE